MREIKFKFWIENAKQMSNVYTLDALLSGGWYDIGSHITLQYTGLKDKNGKEIYEGDIVELLTNGYKYAIYYEDGCFMFGKGAITGYTADMEIIGNIYENPDLLKK